MEKDLMPVRKAEAYVGWLVPEIGSVLWEAQHC